jgi:septal ring factor EnvC (AmiA/AmiB activator)
MKIPKLFAFLFAAAMPMYMSDVQADTPAADPLAADKAALAAAQQQLAADQAAHDQKQKDLDAASEAHAQAHVALQNDLEALQAAQAKLAQDQADLDAKAQSLAAATPAPAVPDEAHDAVGEIEAIALKWGGDIGTDLRNLVGKLRTLLGGKPNAAE